MVIYKSRDDRYVKKDYIYFSWDLKTKKMLIESGDDPIVGRLYPPVENIVDYVNLAGYGLDLLSMLYPSDFEAITQALTLWEGFKFEYSKSRWLWLTPSGEFSWQRGVVL